MAKILVVDDERQILQLLRTVLTRAGHEIHTAGDARTALEMCHSPAAFDLVLSDVDMPEMSGHDLARWIAAKDLDIRIMLMSAFEQECDQCPYLPRCELIRKPFTPSDLVKRIAAVLGT
ncbi:MAG TPA: response regulator [Bryobacteraceae bacterium]|nr:response regulator [Bryobacteraceae bacterium]